MEYIISLLWCCGPFWGHGLHIFLPLLPFFFGRLPISYVKGRQRLSVRCSPICYVVFLLALFLRNFFLKSSFGCGSIPSTE